MKMTKDIICIKLGGSVITDKSTPYTARTDTIRQIAKTLRKIKKPLLITHGVGSFAHTSAKKYGGKNGYTDKWGIAKVASDVMEINTIVMNIFIEEGLPAISFSPRSMQIAKKGKLYKSFFDPIYEALSQDLIPVVYGDGIWDIAQKTTIFSGETTLSYICKYLQKKDFTISKVIQLSDVDGVLDHKKKVIPQITQKNWQEVKGFINSGNVVDVTGGMTHKVEESLALTKYGISTLIINGNKTNGLKNALLNKLVQGTQVC